MSALDPLSQGRKRQPVTRVHTEEDVAITQIVKETESRLAMKRKERDEARRIRMLEIERMKREMDEKSDRKFIQQEREQRRNDLEKKSRLTAVASAMSDSRRSSDAEEESRDVRVQLRDLEERYKKAMMSVAQLENEKSTLTYELDLTKDTMEDMSETSIEGERQCREANRRLEQQKREYRDLRHENSVLRQLVQQRDVLIKENGLLMVGGEQLDEQEAAESELVNGSEESSEVRLASAALVSPAISQLLDLAGSGTLDVRLQRFVEQQSSLKQEVQQLRQDVERERERAELAEKYSSPARSLPAYNGLDVQLQEQQRVTEQQLSDYKLRLQKQDKEMTTLQGTVTRLETQVKRFKGMAESSEALIDDLKQERRKLQRELREAQSQLEDLQTAKAQLERRLEKLKQSRASVLK